MDLFFWLDRKVFKANYPKWDSLRLELIRRVCFFVCVSVNALIERNFTEVPAWDLGAFFSVSQPMSHLYYLIMSCFLGMNLNPIYRKISMFFVQRMPRMGKYIDIRYTPAIEINKSNCPLQDESRKKSPKQNLSLFFQNTSLWRGVGTLPWSGLNFQMFLPMIWNWGLPVSWPRWTRSCKRVAVGYFGISRPTTMSTRLRPLIPTVRLVSMSKSWGVLGLVVGWRLNSCTFFSIFFPSDGYCPLIVASNCYRKPLKSDYLTIEFMMMIHVHFSGYLILFVGCFETSMAFVDTGPSYSSWLCWTCPSPQMMCWRSR